MRLTLFYDHLLDPVGGAPVGLHHLLRALPDDAEVSVWARRRAEAEPDLGASTVRRYDSTAELHRQLGAWLDEDRPDVVIVIGFYIPANPPVAARLRRAGVPFVVAPLGQLATSTMDGRVFSQGCDVGDLEQQTLNLDNALDRIRDRTSPAIKRLYTLGAGRPMLAAAAAAAAMSEIEAAEIHAVDPDTTIVRLPWGVDTATLVDEPDDELELWTDDDRTRLIVWSRLDWYFKGLDRVLAATDAAARTTGTAPFRVLLCGPDYRGGSNLAREAATTNAADIAVASTGEYTPGSKRPLREADGAVLLSRWDGSPRALREAVHFGLPLLVSPATHFADLVESTGAGIVVDDPEDVEAGATAVAEFVDGIRSGRFRPGVERLAHTLDWTTIGRDLVDQLATLAPVRRRRTQAAQ
ncbi:MAG: glycosyltransferase [Actinomycetota bacterium]